MGSPLPINYMRCFQQTLKNTEGAIKNEQSRETGNKTKENKTKTQHNMCCTSLSPKEHK